MFKTSNVFVENRRCVFNTYLYSYCEVANLSTLSIRSFVPVSLLCPVYGVEFRAIQWCSRCGNTQIAKFSCPDEVILISLVCLPGWRKLHNEVLWGSYCWSDTRAVKCRRLSWSEQVARVDVLRYVFKIIVKPEEQRQFLELVCVFEYNINEGVWTGCIWARWCSLAGSYERDNEILGSIKMWNFMTMWGNVSFSRSLIPRGISFFLLRCFLCTVWDTKMACCAVLLFETFPRPY
jgi:hypothetical protein